MAPQGRRSEWREYSNGIVQTAAMAIDPFCLFAKKKRTPAAQ